MKTKKLEVMTPIHPKWEDFCSRLEGPEGCDFQEKNGEFTWECKGGFDKTKSISILKKMGGIDVEKSLKFFEENGGHCDCEILFNVDQK